MGCMLKHGFCEELLRPCGIEHGIGCGWVFSVITEFGQSAQCEFYTRESDKGMIIFDLSNTTE